VYIRALSLLDDLYSGEAQSLMADNARQYPDSALLQDAALVTRLSAAGLEGVPASGDAASGHSPAGDHVVIRAARLAAADDWPGIAGLEAELAGIPWASIWSPLALRLRVESRARLLADVTDTVSDVDGIEMIDRLSIIEPNPQLFLLRAMNAGDDSYALTESLFRYSLAILQGLVAPADVPRRDFDALRGRFAQLEEARRVYPYHHVEVQNTLAAVDTMLE
jgi:hypothetical protein